MSKRAILAYCNIQQSSWDRANHHCMFLHHRTVYVDVYRSLITKSLSPLSYVQILSKLIINGSHCPVEVRCLHRRDLSQLAFLGSAAQKVKNLPSLIKESCQQSLRHTIGSVWRSFYNHYLCYAYL